MKRYGEPFKVYSVCDSKTGKRIGRYRRKKTAESKAKKLSTNNNRLIIKPSPNWFVDLREAGYRNSWRCTYANTLEEAKAVVDTWRVEAKKEENAKEKIEKGDSPPKPHWKPIGFNSASRTFLDAKKLEGITEKTHNEYEHFFRDRFLPHFGGKQLHEVEYEDVQAYFKNRSKPSKSGKKPSPYLLRRERNLLRQFFRWAIVRRHTSHDPTMGLKIEKPIPKENRILDREEVSALLESCRKPYQKKVTAFRNAGSRIGGKVKPEPSTYKQSFTPPPWLYDIVVLALTTGLRLGNLVNLTWEQANLKRKRIDLPALSMKNRRPMTVFLNKDALLILKKRHSKRTLKDSGRVFPNNDNRTVNRSFSKAVKRSGIGKCRFHDLRKTCASWLAAAGVNLNAVMAITGHQTLDVTLKHYLAVTENQRRDAVEKIKLPSA